MDFEYFKKELEEKGASIFSARMSEKDLDALLESLKKIVVEMGGDPDEILKHHTCSRCKDDCHEVTEKQLSIYGETMCMVGEFLSKSKIRVWAEKVTDIAKLVTLKALTHEKAEKQCEDIIHEYIYDDIRCSERIIIRISKEVYEVNKEKFPRCKDYVEAACNSYYNKKYPMFEVLTTFTANTFKMLKKGPEMNLRDLAHMKSWMCELYWVVQNKKRGEKSNA